MNDTPGQRKHDGAGDAPPANQHAPDAQPTAPPTGSSNPDADRSSDQSAGILRAVARGLLALIILGLGIFAALYFNWTEGTVQSGEGEAESARLVEIIRVQPETTRVTVRAMGTVMPAREVVIRPRVSGKIVRQHESFVPGGHFEADQFMLQIDRTDYRFAVQQRRSELAQAEATLKIEKGDQAVAREELSLLESDIADINRDLILRKPQVNQAEASVTSAQAALNQAQLDLERTRLEAPFDGQIVSRSVTSGNNVSQGDQLATYVGSDRYWIRASVPTSHLRWITLPNGGEQPGSPVRVTNTAAWGEDASRQGRVTQFIGQLEAQSRMAQVMVSVQDPLAIEPANEGKPRLILGAFVDLVVQGDRVEDVIVMDRDYLREGGVVWVMNGEDELETRDVSVLFRGKSRAYVENGLQDGDRVVMTNLSAPVEGMLLRTASSGDAVADAEEAGNE